MEDGVGTYFNRAVVSSQAFIREFGAAPKDQKYIDALNWLSNGMGEAVSEFITQSDAVDGAAYHLTDAQWVLPALNNFKPAADGDEAAANGEASFIYFHKDPGTGKNKGDTTNDKIVSGVLESKVQFYKRTKTAIMHDKFMVRSQNGKPVGVLMGTANFTLEGLTSQANVVHTFDSPALAKLYLDRQVLLRTDPSVASTAKEAGWSNKVSVGKNAKVRVFFAPEAPAGNKSKGTPGSRVSIDVVVNAVKNAKSSVIFSLFSATDAELLEACKATAGEDKMMYGLVNTISEPKAAEPGTELSTTASANLELYNLSKDDNMVVGHSSFTKAATPTGFWWEVATLRAPGTKVVLGKGKKNSGPPPVYDHQKIVVIDGESDKPTIFVGSANLSGASTWHNDENLLEITGSPPLAKMYVAEFLRLYEQYRARYSWNQRQKEDGNKPTTFSLAKDVSWCSHDYKPGTPQYKARVTLAGE